VSAATSTQGGRTDGGERDLDHPATWLLHPLQAVSNEAGILLRLAREGQSGATPLILVATVIVLLVPLVSLVIGLAFLAASLTGS
jgi:hypothetical protein